MKLIGGPYNERDIFDMGAAVIHLAIRDGRRLGSAIYEVDNERNIAFWLENEWLGEIVDEIRHDQ